MKLEGCIHDPWLECAEEIGCRNSSYRCPEADSVIVLNHGGDEADKGYRQPSQEQEHA